MFVKRESVADPTGLEQNCIEEIVVGRVSVTETFAGVEEEGYIDAFECALFAEPEEFRGEGVEGSAVVFGSDEVIAGEEGRVEFLGLDTLFHVFPAVLVVSHALV